MTIFSTLTLQCQSASLVSTRKVSPTLATKMMMMSASLAVVISLHQPGSHFIKYSDKCLCYGCVRESVM